MTRSRTGSAMPWDDARFDHFVRDTIRMARGQLPGYGFPHVILPYPPKEELLCIREVRSMPPRLSQVGLAAEVIPVVRYLARAAARFARRPLQDADEYRRLQADLSEPKSGLVARTVALCADELREKGAGGRV